MLFKDGIGRSYKGRENQQLPQPIWTGCSWTNIFDFAHHLELLCLLYLNKALPEGPGASILS